MKRREAWVFLGLLGLGLALRLIAISSRTLWYDDTFSVFLSQQSLAKIISGTAADTMPPLYYFLLHFWIKLDMTPAWMRLLNVILSLGIVGMVYGWVRELAGKTAAVWAGLITAVSPLEIYHAQELRMYTLLTLALAGYAWAFTHLVLCDGNAKDQRLAWLALIISGVTAMYSHNLAAFTLVVPDLYLLVKMRRKLFGRLLLAQAIILLGALPWLIYLPGQIEKIQLAFWTPRPGVVEIIQALVIFVSNMPVPAVLIALSAIVGLQAIALVTLEAWRAHRQAPGIGPFAWFALLPPALLFAASYLMRPVFVPRAFMLSSLAFYGLVGWLAASARVPVVGRLTAGLFAIAALAGLPFQITYDKFPRSPYQQAARLLIANSNPGTAVVHDNKLSYFPVRFYAPDLAESFLADPLGSHNDTLAPATQAAIGLYPVADIQSAMQGAARVEFVVFTKAIQEYLDDGEAEHPVLAWLDANYRLAGKQTAGDIEIYDYRK